MKVEIVKEFDVNSFREKIENIINNNQLIDIKYNAETKYIGSQVIYVYNALLIID